MAVRAPARGTRLHIRETLRVAPEAGGPHGKYLSITTYRRDGAGVATPVWFVAERDHLLVMTAAESGKVKRVKRTPFVTVAACSARGKLRGTPITARAEVLPSIEVERVKRLMGRKYRFDLFFIRPIRALQALLHPERRNEVTTILSITPTSS
jgi:uncharacterized protein